MNNGTVITGSLVSLLMFLFPGWFEARQKCTRLFFINQKNLVHFFPELGESYFCVLTTQNPSATMVPGATVETKKVFQALFLSFLCDFVA